MKEIDARGLACPKPVVLTKKAMAKNDENLIIVVIKLLLKM
jgi:TusA-related sulfurtransferase